MLISTICRDNKCLWFEWPWCPSDIIVMTLQCRNQSSRMMSGHYELQLGFTNYDGNVGASLISVENSIYKLWWKCRGSIDMSRKFASCEFHASCGILHSVWTVVHDPSCNLQVLVPYMYRSRMGSYHKISQSLEAATFIFGIVRSLWNLTSTLAIVLSMCQSNFKAMG